jgi:hypothetical protein
VKVGWVVFTYWEDEEEEEEVQKVLGSHSDLVILWRSKQHVERYLIPPPT